MCPTYGEGIPIPYNRSNKSGFVANVQVYMFTNIIHIHPEDQCANTSG
jgi:hypothetical protein